MLRVAILAVFLLTSTSTRLTAQWRAGLEFGVERFGSWVQSRGEGGETGPSGRPTTTWPLTLRLEHGGAGVRLGVSANRTEPGLELFSNDLRVAVHPAFRIWAIAPDVSIRMAGLGNGGQLRVGIAAPVERWSFPVSADLPRWRLGAAGSVIAEFPMGPRMTARISGSAETLFRHPLTDTEQIEDYRPDSLWRRSLRMGVHWRL